MRFIETVSGRVVAGAGGEGGVESFLMGMAFQFCRIKRILVIGCTTMRMHFIFLNCIFQNG